MACCNVPTPLSSGDPCKSDKIYMHIGTGEPVHFVNELGENCTSFAVPDIKMRKGWYFMDDREFKMRIRKLRNHLQTFWPSARPHSREMRKHYRQAGDYPF